jgi:hypothetical protein
VKHPSFTATSGEGSTSHDLRLRHPRPNDGALKGRNVAGVAPRAGGRARTAGQEDPCCQTTMRFPGCERWTAMASHHLNTKQWRRTGRSFAYKASNDASRPSGYQREGRGLHGKPPTYQTCKTQSWGQAALEQGPPPTPPYRTTMHSTTYGANRRRRSTPRHCSNTIPTL